MIVGFRQLAKAAGVSPSQAARDYRDGLVSSSGQAPCNRGNAGIAFADAEVARYHQYRMSRAGKTRVPLPVRRKRIEAAAGQKALDAAWRAGYNAGRRARQREEKVYGIASE